MNDTIKVENEVSFVGKSEFVDKSKFVDQDDWYCQNEEIAG